MKKHITSLLLCGMLASCASSLTLSDGPIYKKGDVCDTFFSLFPQTFYEKKQRKIKPANRATIAYGDPSILITCYQKPYPVKPINGITINGIEWLSEIYEHGAVLYRETAILLGNDQVNMTTKTKSFIGIWVFIPSKYENATSVVYDIDKLLSRL